MWTWVSSDGYSIVYVPTITTTPVTNRIFFYDSRSLQVLTIYSLSIDNTENSGKKGWSVVTEYGCEISY